MHHEIYIPGAFINVGTSEQEHSYLGVHQVHSRSSNQPADWGWEFVEVPEQGSGWIPLRHELRGQARWH